jgi:hypothetical protein
VTFIVAARGVEGDRIIGGRRIKTIPFVGADGGGSFSSMGVGLLYPDEKSGVIWGLALPHKLIQSWRAMEILKRVTVIGHGTICACWYAAGQTVHDSDRPRLDDLAEKVGGMKKLQAIRSAVLASAPATDELSSMIAVLRRAGVTFESYELEEEVAAGRIERLPIMETLKQEEQVRRDRYAQEQEAVVRPPPSHAIPPKSLLATVIGWIGFGR